MPDYRLECPQCGRLLAKANGERVDVDAAAALLLIMCRSTRCDKAERTPVVALWRKN